jgi:diacylglycerol kinase
MKNKFLETGEHGYNPLRKLKVILSGIRFAVIYDFSVMYKIVLSLVVLIFAIIYRDLVDVSLIIIATGFMIAGEMFNTAIEAVCDFMETRYDEKIGIIKDIAAAAAGITIFVWIAVLGIELYKMAPFIIG